VGKTKEYAERQYYNNLSEYIAQNPFWYDLYTHLAEHGTSKPFLPESFIFANNSHTEMIAVLGFVSVPFKAESHKFVADEGLGLKITA